MKPTIGRIEETIRELEEAGASRWLKAEMQRRLHRWQARWDELEAGSEDG